MFEKIGLAQVDKPTKSLKIEVNGKMFLVGLLDLNRALSHQRVIIGVFQIAEKQPEMSEPNKKEKQN